MLSDIFWSFCLVTTLVNLVTKTTILSESAFVICVVAFLVFLTSCTAAIYKLVLIEIWLLSSLAFAVLQFLQTKGPIQIAVISSLSVLLLWNLLDFYLKNRKSYTAVGELDEVEGVNEDSDVSAEVDATRPLIQDPSQSTNPNTPLETQDQTPITTTDTSTPTIDPILTKSGIRSLCFSLFSTLSILYGIILLQEDVVTDACNNESGNFYSGYNRRTFLRIVMGIYCVIAGIVAINHECTTVGIERNKGVKLYHLTLTVVGSFLIIMSNWNDLPVPTNTFYNLFVIVGVSLTAILTMSSDLIGLAKKYREFRYELCKYSPTDDAISEEDLLTPEPVPQNSLDFVLQVNAGASQNGRLITIDKTAVVEDAESAHGSESSVASRIDLSTTHTTLREDLRILFKKHVDFNLCVQTLLVLTDIWMVMTPMFRSRITYYTCNNHRLSNSTYYFLVVHDSPQSFFINTALISFGFYFLVTDLVWIKSASFDLVQRSILFCAIAIMHLDFSNYDMQYVVIERVYFVLSGIHYYTGANFRKLVFRPIWKLEIFEDGTVALENEESQPLLTSSWR
jgi:hypothetical protein